MKGILSQTMINVHPFDVFSKETVSVQTRNLKVLAKEILNKSKGIARNIFAKILISMPPENFSPHYQSGFHLNPGKFGI